MIENKSLLHSSKNLKIKKRIEMRFFYSDDLNKNQDFFNASVKEYTVNYYSALYAQPQSHQALMVFHLE